MNEPLHTESALGVPLSALQLERRARDVCRQLGIETVGELVARDREDFMAVKGCGPKTVKQIELALQVYRADHAPPGGPDAAATVDPSAALDSILPTTLLGLQITALDLPSIVASELAAQGRHCVRDLFASPLDLAEEARLLIRSALERVLAIGLDQPTPGEDVHAFAQLSARLLSTLSLEAQEMLRQHLGLSGPPLNARELAAKRGDSVREAKAGLTAARRRLRAKAKHTLAIIRDEGRLLLDKNDGIATPDCTRPGSILHDAAREGADSVLPFRLLSFCFPQEFFILERSLTRTPPHRVEQIQQSLKRLTRASYLPVQLADLRSMLASRGLHTDRALLLHLVLGMGLAASTDPLTDRLTIFRRDEVADRVIDILTEQDGPLCTDDLVFHYRDRHRSCHKGRLLEHLRAESRMLEIGPDLWALKSRHERELRSVADQARDIAQRIREIGGRHSVRDLATEQLSERAAHLITNCLRRDSSLRDLGKSEFCAVDQKHSRIMREITGDLTRAMGELPVSRFLDNQLPNRRRLVARLLRENRLFVEPSPDRVDLLTNYPFNTERLNELRRIVDAHLGTCGGYSRLSRVLEVVQQSDLGGSFLTEHLLADLLRRHGSFEILTDGFVAQPSIRLGGWIQAKAREALRLADLPLSADDILARAPELAEFADSLLDLLETDPLVMHQDSGQFRVI